MYINLILDTETGLAIARGEEGWGGLGGEGGGTRRTDSRLD